MKRNVMLFFMVVLFSSITINGCGNENSGNIRQSEIHKTADSTEKATEKKNTAVKKKIENKSFDEKESVEKEEKSHKDTTVSENQTKKSEKEQEQPAKVKEVQSDIDYTSNLSNTENTMIDSENQAQQEIQAAASETMQQPQQPAYLTENQNPETSAMQQPQQSVYPTENQDLETSDPTQVLQGGFVITWDSIVQESEHVHNYTQPISVPYTERRIAGVEKYVVCCNTIIDADTAYNISAAALCGDPCPFCGQVCAGDGTRFVYEDVVQEKIIGYMCSCGDIAE